MSGGLWFSSDTAIAWACRELIKGRTISHPDEIGEAGAWRLGLSKDATVEEIRQLLVPVFTPAVSGARIGHEQINDGPRWHHIIETGELEQPDGIIVTIKEQFP